jgi:hypothetical protein
MRYLLNFLIPAKAGTQLSAGFQLGPRLRGDDRKVYNKVSL